VSGVEMLVMWQFESLKMCLLKNIYKIYKICIPCDAFSAADLQEFRHKI